MGRHSRPGATLAVAIVMAFPGLFALLNGNLRSDQFAMRFLLGLGVAWIGVSVVAFVIDGYTPVPPLRARTSPDSNGPGTSQPDRRRSAAADEDGAAERA